MLLPRKAARRNPFSKEWAHPFACSHSPIASISETRQHHAHTKMISRGVVVDSSTDLLSPELPELATRLLDHGLLLSCWKGRVIVIRHLPLLARRALSNIFQRSGLSG